MLKFLSIWTGPEVIFSCPNNCEVVENYFYETSINSELELCFEVFSFLKNLDNPLSKCLPCLQSIYDCCSIFSTPPSVFLPANLLQNRIVCPHAFMSKCTRDARSFRIFILKVQPRYDRSL